MAAHHPGAPFCFVSDRVWILHLTCWTSVCIRNYPLSMLGICYAVTMQPPLWSLVIEHVVNPLRQWEGASCLTFPPTLWFQGLRVTGRETWALAITSTESRTKLERKGPRVNQEERPRERGWNFKNAIIRRYGEARTMVTIHTTAASFLDGKRKKRINIHDPVPPILIQHPPFLPLPHFLSPPLGGNTW